MTADALQEVDKLLARMTGAEREALFRQLRRQFPIHTLESEWNVEAEVILEAISRSNDLTKRGIRGVIAEASFKEYVVLRMIARGWREDVIVSEQAYDFRLADDSGPVAIQVKMQRNKNHRPMLAYEANKKMFRDSMDMWVVETQRTRGGTDSQGEATRPYKFGEFDILAVSLHPSSGDWSKFVYTVADWLLPDPEHELRMFKYQPVPKRPNEDWTEDVYECIRWLRSGLKKRIATTPAEDGQRPLL